MKPQQFASANNLTHIFLPSHAYAVGKKMLLLSLLYAIHTYWSSVYKSCEKEGGKEFLAPE